MSENDPNEGAQPDIGPVAQPDTITRHAVFNTTLQQFVGGVYLGDPPKPAQIKAMLEPLGMAKDDYEVRQV